MTLERRTLSLLLAAGLVLGGAACGDDDEPEADATTTTATTEAAGEPADESTTTASDPEDDDPTTTTSEPDEPGPDDPEEGTVPVEPELQDRLPEVEGYERELDSDESFDSEDCEGNPFPATPVGQGSATYSNGDDGFDIGAVRFSSSSDATAFLEAFIASAEGCAGPDAEVERSDLDLGDEGFVLRLSDGEDRAWAYGAKDNDDVWLAFVELEEGEVEPAPEVLEALTEAVEG